MTWPAKGREGFRSWKIRISIKMSKIGIITKASDKNNHRRSVVDPDPIGSDTFCRIKIQIWIRKNHSGSGWLRIRNEFEVKLLTDNIWQFLNKNAQLKILIPLKKFPKKLKPLHNMQLYGLTRCTKVKIYEKNIRKDPCRIWKQIRNQPTSRIRIKSFRIHKTGQTQNEKWISIKANN